MDAIDMDVIERLLHLQEMDRVRDRLQGRLDQVPIQLRSHTDRIAGLEAELKETQAALQAARAEGERRELDIATKEAERDKARAAMNSPKLTSKEYTILQEQLAGCLADIGSHTDKAVAAMELAEELQGKVAAKREEIREAQEEYAKAKEELLSSLNDVRTQLEEKNRERETFLGDLEMGPLDVYERVRRKHPNPLAAVEGTIDRAAGRIGNDLHCSACYMAITPNDAVHVLARKKVIPCRSCGRILYVP